MAYVTCPKCNMRFQMADSPKAAVTRCPKCAHTFNAPATTPTADAGSVAARIDEPFGSSAGDIAARILSASDEAMLRDYGAGTGLLDLTREALGTAPGDRPRSPRGHNAAADMDERQFQLVATALTMSNRLVDVYKGELSRTRRILLVCWATIAVTVIAAVAALWWGSAQSSSAGYRSEKLTDAQAALTDERSRTSTLATAVQNASDDTKKAHSDLSAAQSSLLKMQADLSKAREDLLSSQASAKQLNSELEAANQKVAQLQRQVEQAAATRPSTPTAMLRN